MRRVEARTEDTEEGRASKGQVGGHVKGNQRSEQRRQKGRGENETEDRQGRNKLSTWFMDMDKQKPGQREMRIIRSRRAGRRAAYRAGQTAMRVGRRECMGMP